MVYALTLCTFFMKTIFLIDLDRLVRYMLTYIYNENLNNEICIKMLNDVCITIKAYWFGYIPKNSHTYIMAKMFKYK